MRPRVRRHARPASAGSPRPPPSRSSCSGCATPRTSTTFGEFAGREGDIVAGVVQQGTRPARTSSSTSARSRRVLPPQEQVPGESYEHGAAAALLRRRRSRKGLRGPVGHAVADAPEPGAQALRARGAGDRRRHRRDRRDRPRGRPPHEDRRPRPPSPGVNAKGACIGPMGRRVRAVMAELHGEKIDIVDWSRRPGRRSSRTALSPARVESRSRSSTSRPRSARVVVPDYQLSLAIGKEGQNARLAARLTGWRIDIRPDTRTRAERPRRSPGPPAARGRDGPDSRQRGKIRPGRGARLPVSGESAGRPVVRVRPAGPVRTCVGCRVRASRADLLRWSRSRSAAPGSSCPTRATARRPGCVPASRPGVSRPRRAPPGVPPGPARWVRSTSRSSARSSPRGRAPRRSRNVDRPRWKRVRSDEHSMSTQR